MPLRLPARLAAAALLWTLASCSGRGGGGGAAATYRIAGTVTGAPGVTVALTGGASVTTAADGGYAFAGLAAGTYTVTPSRSGHLFAPASRTVTVGGAAGDADGADFAATPVSSTWSITGLVTNATGVTLTLSGGASRATVTAGPGTYAFTGLADGAYTLTPSLAGHTFTPDHRTVIVSGADRPEQDFHAAPVAAGSRAISGRVVAAGPVPVTLALSGAATALTTTDAGGNFTFGGLLDGSYIVVPAMATKFLVPAIAHVTVSGADVVLDNFMAEDLVDFPGLTWSGLPGWFWRGGAWHARLEAGAASLGAAAMATVAGQGLTGTLAVAPGAVSGQVTAFGATVALASSTVTGDTACRAGLDLLFQPLADRMGGAANQAGALYLRVALSHTAEGGRVAVRQAFECVSADCGLSEEVGVEVSGGSWPAAGVEVAAETPYTLAIAIDPGTRRVTYTLAGGAYATPIVTVLDLSAVATPFAVDLSAVNAHRTRLFAEARGGATGGGDGAVVARFDDVILGVEGRTPALFDGFGAGTRLDPSRWAVSEAEVEAVDGSPNEVRFVLDPGARPGANTLGLVAAPHALQAEIVVTEATLTGPGHLGAQIAWSLYNDGSGGLGEAPDVPGPGSQVGDVVALIAMSGTDVSYAVVRCDVADCARASGAGLTFLTERTSLGAVAVGEPHLLRATFDVASRTAMFQLDGLAPGLVSPEAAGAPVVGSASVPFLEIGVSAGPEATGVGWGVSTAGRLAATFRNLRMY